MPFCPECKYEYNANVNKCPDCDAWLVGSLDDSNDRQKRTDSSSGSRSTAPAQYSDEIKKIMKSLPATPNISSGPLAPRSKMGTEDIEPDPDSEIARKLEEYDTWIEIAHFPSPDTSQMVADGLESVDIPNVVIPGARVTWYGKGVSSNNSDILLVPEEFVKSADAEAEAIIGEDYEQFKTPNS